MKKLFFILLVAGFSLPLLGQGGNALFFKKLSIQGGVHPTVKAASIGIYNNFIIRDSLLYFTQSFEKAVLQGKSAGAVKPTLIKAAQKKYPGKSPRAVSNRLKMYASESKGR